MKIQYHIILTTGFFLSTIVYAQAQLTVFNVPSSDPTEKNKISVQQQFEVQDLIESSTAFTYGLGKNWEVGLNLFNLDYSIKNKQFEINDTTTVNPFAPLLLASAQKVFKLNDIFSVGIGAMAGTNLAHRHKGLIYYSYSNLVAGLGDQQQYVLAAGPYLSSHTYLGDGPRYGVQAAFDAGIWYEHLHLLGDWVSGVHQKGRLTLGFEFFLTDRLPLALGWQRSNADGSQAAVLQLTFLPK